jgi:DNA-binding transcriptional regulator YdaS (Cro superfamily)
MDNGKIITILGGTTKVAKLCGVSVPAVSQWKNNGIPPDKLIFLAAELERLSQGVIHRKDIFPESWKQIWPELH